LGKNESKGGQTKSRDSTCSLLVKREVDPPRLRREDSSEVENPGNSGKENKKLGDLVRSSETGERRGCIRERFEGGRLGGEGTLEGVGERKGKTLRYFQVLRKSDWGSPNHSGSAGRKRRRKQDSGTG